MFKKIFMLIQVLNSPESCCGLKEKTVLKIALDVGEKFLKLRVILKSLLITTEHGYINNAFGKF